MTPRSYLVTGRVIDAIHAQLATSMNRDVRPLGVNITSASIIEHYDATALACEVQERVAASSEHDAHWVAALYAVLLARNRVYRTTNVGTALVTMCVVLARAGLRLEADEREVFAAMQAVSSKEFRHEELTNWLRQRCVRRKQVSPPIAS